MRPHSLCYLIIFFSLLSRWETASAHTFLLLPKADFKAFHKPECRIGGPSHAPNDSCSGPCIATTSWQYNPNARITTYRRGQMVHMAWARNNHGSGFVRFSLVRESDRMNKMMHKRMAFRYACFDSDKHTCWFDTSKERRCGTDTFLHRTRVVIPTALEDGMYVLGFAWFGGAVGENSLFADYWSCARVKIRGGPITHSYQPVFEPGENLPEKSGKMCPSTTADVGRCPVEPCYGFKKKLRVPAVFNNAAPAAILREWSRADTVTPHEIVVIIPKAPEAWVPLRTHGIKGLNLIDTETMEIYASRYSTVIPLVMYNGLTFEAMVTGEVRRVKFVIKDDSGVFLYTRTEQKAPYYCFGDDNGTVHGWNKPMMDKWFTVNVTVNWKDDMTRYRLFTVRLTTVRVS